MAQGDTLGYDNGKEGLFYARGKYRGCRVCSEPSSVTPEEDGLKKVASMSGMLVWVFLIS